MRSPFRPVFRSPPDRRVWNRRRAAASRVHDRRPRPDIDGTGPADPPEEFVLVDYPEAPIDPTAPDAGDRFDPLYAAAEGYDGDMADRVASLEPDSSSTRRWRGPTARPFADVEVVREQIPVRGRRGRDVRGRPSTRGTRSVPRERRSARSRPGRTTASRTGRYTCSRTRREATRSPTSGRVGSGSNRSSHASTSRVRTTALARCSSSVPPRTTSSPSMSSSTDRACWPRRCATPTTSVPGSPPASDGGRARGQRQDRTAPRRRGRR